MDRDTFSLFSSLEKNGEVPLDMLMEFFCKAMDSIETLAGLGILKRRTYETYDPMKFVLSINEDWPMGMCLTAPETVYCALNDPGPFIRELKSSEALELVERMAN